MIYFNARREENYPVIKYGITLQPDNREKVRLLFATLLNKNRKWFRMDLDSYYRRLLVVDKYSNKVNQRYKKEFREITKEFLVSQGCVDFTLNKGDYGDSFTCTTSFGVRTINVIRMVVDADIDNAFSYYTIGIRLTGYKRPSVLDYKSVSGGVESIICEDYTKHFAFFKEKLVEISPIFSTLEFGIMNGK